MVHCSEFGHVGLARRAVDRRGRMNPTSQRMREPEKGGGWKQTADKTWVMIRAR